MGLSLYFTCRVRSSCVNTMSSQPPLPCFRKLMNEKYFRSQPACVLSYRAKLSVMSLGSFLGVSVAEYF